MRRYALIGCLILFAAAVLLAPVVADSHPERTTAFTNPATGSVPSYRTTGPSLVVCKPDSAALLAASYGVKLASVRHPAHRTRRRAAHRRAAHRKASRRRGVDREASHRSATTARARTQHHRLPKSHRRRAARRPGRPIAVGSAEYRQRVALLSHCGFHDIQAAVNAARSGYRIQIMPGVYREQPSRAVPFGAPGQPPCANDYVTVEGQNRDKPPPAGPRSNDLPERANRNYAIKCPNSKNLIAVVGDTRPEPNPAAPILPLCLQLCNLQIEGMGSKPQDVLIQSDRIKNDVLRIDRANGVYLKNFSVEQGAFNDVDLVEVDGFKIENVIARYAQNYGVLSFTATHGLYDHVTAYGNGDSGLYPGSTMKGCGVDPNAYGTCEASGCGHPSIEIRNSLSYGNTLGYSGTAGNSTYVHDNRFYDNASGLATDSFASGHPGMPQECFDWERNQIYSNNNNVFNADRQSFCGQTPFVKRPKEIVCPQFQTPVGTGIVMGGANRDLIKNNYIYDNWRQGVLLLTVPASIRGDNDPSHQQDTSNGNRFIGNTMGAAPDGTTMRNGLDFEWDSGGKGNCWQGNRMGSASDPATLPACPGSPIWVSPNPAVTSTQVPCTAWDPENQPQPPGCDWFTTPPKP